MTYGDCAIGLLKLSVYFTLIYFSYTALRARYPGGHSVGHLLLALGAFYTF